MAVHCHPCMAAQQVKVFLYLNLLQALECFWSQRKSLCTGWRRSCHSKVEIQGGRCAHTVFVDKIKE